ncbi:fructosamine kinase family protein [Aliikangiella coralliicola]|uniref:fructosamine kinase family protein n=1 Tax=Aliikangiella coralliicola TaxID=2592383 RepID=UPI00143D6538|nr:fructosamine kinase family protein [Aliikangiella coralliicola]
MDLWQHIRLSISQAIDDDLQLVQHSPVSGGDINQAYRLETSKSTFFIKLNRAELLEMFVAEANGLECMAATKTIKVPSVITSGEYSNQSFLVLEHLHLGGLQNIGKFAVELAELHRCSNANFGFSSDNYIGSTPQSNQQSDNWLEFYAEQRIGFQLSMLSKKGASSRLLEKGKAVQKNIAQFFDDYLPTPALIHGDLWQGNYGYMRGNSGQYSNAESHTGRPVIYDPACYFADHEAELAMLELFGNPGEVFFREYHQVFPIDRGYPVRRTLYNLYHILNHVNLFGGGYENQAERMMDELLK